MTLESTDANKNEKDRAVAKDALDQNVQDVEKNSAALQQLLANQAANEKELEHQKQRFEDAGDELRRAEDVRAASALAEKNEAYLLLKQDHEKLQT